MASGSERAATPAARPHAEPEVRIRLALRGLEKALAEQRAAVAEWRSTLRDLGTAVSGLDAGLTDLQAGLGSLRGRVAEAGDAARRLARTADAMTAVARG